jgi:hypothetical protein
LNPINRVGAGFLSNQEDRSTARAEQCARIAMSDELACH